MVTILQYHIRQKRWEYFAFRQNWEDAYATCNEVAGGDMVSILNEDEQKTLEKLLYVWDIVYHFKCQPTDIHQNDSVVRIGLHTDLVQQPF